VGSWRQVLGNVLKRGGLKKVVWPFDFAFAFSVGAFDSSSLVLSIFSLTSLMALLFSLSYTLSLTTLCLSICLLDIM